MAFTLSSPAFANNTFMPVQYTCDGDNISPPLTWTDVPEGTVEFALLFEDPDAPGGTLVHWVLFGISPDLDGLEEGKAPPGALGEPSGLAEGASPRDDLPYALSGKVLGQTQLTGKYARKR